STRPRWGSRRSPSCVDSSTGAWTMCARSTAVDCRRRGHSRSSRSAGRRGARSNARRSSPGCATANSPSWPSLRRPTQRPAGGTDSCYGWGDYGVLVGARFDGHPWTQSFTAEVLDPSHPACAHLGTSWPWHDEVYQFRDLRPDARVLLRVPDDQLDLDAPGARRPSFGYPLAWCFEEGAGRVLSTSLGHFPAAWESPTYLRHLEGGLAWVLGIA